MKIAITGDSHLGFLTDWKKGISSLRSEIRNTGAEVCCILGDMTGGDGQEGRRGLDDLLRIAPTTFFVMGNHDLWTVTGGSKKAPDDALRIHQQQWFQAGWSLEKDWDDTDTFVSKNGCVFIGTMGFPDFAHPIFPMPANYYDKRGCTNDMYYLKLSLGWVYYTKRMEKAFSARLDKALAGDENSIIICTHYCIFDCQCKISDEEISAYFFNYGIGQMILDKAKAYPNKTFWCFSAHSHDYCRGQMVSVSDNVRAFGLSTDYGSLSYLVFDPSGDLNQDFKIHQAYWESKWT